jgi:pimeloyl-ACP methyl ester carboxylesterase
VSGDGPAVVLVHGGGGSDFSWRLVLPYLTPRFTAYAVQRRGRGNSGDGKVHSLAHEAEDIAAVVESIPGGAFLVGHSVGATIALEACLLSKGIRKLALYEPAIRLQLPPGHLEHLESLLADGRHDEVLTIALKQDAGLTDEEIAALKAAPSWQERLALAPTGPREMRAVSAYDILAGRFKEMTTATLLLLGTLTKERFQYAAAQIQAEVPNVQVSWLKDQGHLAIATAPELLATRLAEFFLG